MPHAEKVSFTASEEDAGRRLDQVLAARVPDLSRRRARVLLDIGGVFVDGRRCKVAGRPVRAGEKIVAHVGGALERATKEVGRAARARDEEKLARYQVVFEDDDLIVVEKPAGLLVAATPESDRTNLASLLARRRMAPGAPPDPIFVVHRIDLETSGLLVLAKTPLANRVLSERFRTHDLEREYLAVVRGSFPPAIARVDTPIEGRRAVTHFSVERAVGAAVRPEQAAAGTSVLVPATLVRCRLETGRTHQIRIHAQSVGHPVLGDPRYGERPPAWLAPPRMALHACRLAFAHPGTGAPLAFDSPLPEDLAGWLAGLGPGS